MYTTLRGIEPGGITRPEIRKASPAGGPRRTSRTVSRIVVTLGAVSFFTDLSSEMVVAVLPVYLTLVLGLSPVQYGLIDGLYQGVTAGVRIIGGLAADLTRRPKIVATVGYALSCGCKLLFLPAHSFAAITGLVALDRSGKGLRTAPRDAMIAAAAEPASLGYAFGIHRAMDTAGALGGPLLAVGVLAVLTDGYQLIFVLSFGLAAVGVAILVLFVPGTDRQKTVVEGPPEGTARNRRFGGLGGDLRALARHRGYRRLLGVGGLLSLTTISDGFVYLILRDRADLGVTLFPLLYVGTAATYLVLAVPLGRLADRIGRIRVFLAGHLLAAVGYLGLFLLPPGPALVSMVLALVGGYYAATDGVLPALTAPLVPDTVAGTGIAGVQTVMAVGGMLSAAIFGGLWARFGPQAALGCFAVALLLAVGVATVLLRPARLRPPGPAGPTSAGLKSVGPKPVGPKSAGA